MESPNGWFSNNFNTVFLVPAVKNLIKTEQPTAHKKPAEPKISSRVVVNSLKFYPYDEWNRLFLMKINHLLGKFKGLDKARDGGLSLISDIKSGPVIHRGANDIQSQRDIDPTFKIQ